MNQHHQPPGPPSNPFEGDLLERQPTVKDYTALLKKAEGRCVLALNGGLGAGKTTFIGFWEKYLGNEGFKTATFNVWKQGLTPQDLAGKIGEISHGHTEGRPLVVFIDELDQRLPSSIDEFFRHLEPIFRKENRVFVLPINKHEVERSLKLARGEEFDVTGYLGRFLDCELKLPKEESARKEFVRKKCEILGIPASKDEAGGGETGITREVLADFLGTSDLEIRGILKVLSLLQLIFRSVPAGTVDYALFTSCFLLLRVFDRELYGKFTRQEVSDEYVYEQLKQPNWKRIDRRPWAIFWSALMAIYIHWKSVGLINEGCEESPLWRTIHAQAQQREDNKEKAAARLLVEHVRMTMDSYHRGIEVGGVIQRIDALDDEFNAS